jgi:hypothetical protein
VSSEDEVQEFSYRLAGGRASPLLRVPPTCGWSAAIVPEPKATAPKPTFTSAAVIKANETDGLAARSMLCHPAGPAALRQDVTAGVDGRGPPDRTCGVAFLRVLLRAWDQSPRRCSAWSMWEGPVLACPIVVNAPANAARCAWPTIQRIDEQPPAGGASGANRVLGSPRAIVDRPALASAGGLGLDGGRSRPPRRR